jgi:hypothetical protein
MAFARPPLLLAISACMVFIVMMVLNPNNTTLTKQLRNAPPDVVAVATRALECQRELSVEVSNEASDATVNSILDALNCNSIEAEQVVLRRKYQSSPRALKSLDITRTLLR